MFSEVAKRRFSGLTWYDDGARFFGIYAVSGDVCRLQK